MCLATLVYNCQRDISQLVSARNVFVLTIIAWYVFEMVLLPDELQIFSQARYNFGALCVSLSLIAFLIGYSQTTRGRAFHPLFSRLAEIDNPKVLWGVFLIAVAIGFAPLLFVAKGNIWLILDDFLIPKERFSGIFQRGRYGGWRDAMLELQMFLRAAIPLGAAILVHRRQPAAQRGIAFLFLGLMFAKAFNSGTRSKVIEVFLPIAAGLYWRTSAEWKRRALWFGLPALVVVGLFWSAATVIGRNHGEVRWDQATDAKYVGFEMFRELLFISEAIPEQADFKMGRTYYVQAVNPIPRAIWSGKPIDDAGLELAKLKGMVAHGDAFLTVSPGLLGEMYWNFGVPGIVALSGLLGYFAKSWDAIRPFAGRSILAFTVFAAGLAIIFLSGRSVNMSTLYGMLALFALLVLFSNRAAH